MNNASASNLVVTTLHPWPMLRHVVGVLLGLVAVLLVVTAAVAHVALVVALH
jgi:hypothetical protein